MKKFISFILTVTMFFAFCVPVYAASPNEVGTINANGEILALNKLLTLVKLK